MHFMFAEDELGLYTRLVQNNHGRLLSLLRPTEVVEILYENGHLDDRELDQLSSMRNDTEQNEKLFGFLRTGAACRCFYEALGQTAQAELQREFTEECKYPQGTCQKFLWSFTISCMIERMLVKGNPFFSNN